MKELGPAAREFIESHRRAGSLPDAARARIKHKLMVRVSAMGATPAVAATAARMSLASKVVLAALGVTGAVAVGSLSLWASRSRPPAHVTPAETSGPADREMPAAAAAPDRAAPVIVAAGRATAPAGPVAMPAPALTAPARVAASVRAATPRVATAPANPRAFHPSTTPIPAAPSASSVSVDSERPGPLKKIADAPDVSPSATAPPPARRVDVSDPEPELRAVREARDDLRAGRPARAYRRLEDFNRQSPGGMLAEERSALSAIALCQAQPGREAQERAAQFLRRSPESPLAARVRSACDPARRQSW